MRCNKRVLVKGRETIPYSVRSPHSRPDPVKIVRKMGVGGGGGAGGGLFRHLLNEVALGVGVGNTKSSAAIYEDLKI